MLEPNALTANIVGSVQTYVLAKLAPVPFDAVTQIDFGGGIQFNDEALAEWLQVRMLEPARPSFMSASHSMLDGDVGIANARATEMFWLINLNLFVRPAKLAAQNNLRLWTLRDAVMRYFTPLRVIPVYHYALDGSLIGNLLLDEIDRDQPVSDPSRDAELLQHNIVIAARWTEQWTAS